MNTPYPFLYQCVIRIWWFRCVLKDLRTIFDVWHSIEPENGSLTFRWGWRSNLTAQMNTSYPLSYQCFIYIWWFKFILKELWAIFDLWPSIDPENGSLTFRWGWRSNLTAQIETSYPLSYQCFIHMWWFRSILRELQATSDVFDPCDLERALKVICRGAQLGNVTFHDLWGVLSHKI